MSAHRRLPVSRARAQVLADRATAFRESSEARLWQSLSGSKLGVAFRAADHPRELLQRLARMLTLQSLRFLEPAILDTPGQPANQQHARER